MNPDQELGCGKRFKKPRPIGRGESRIDLKVVEKERQEMLENFVSGK
ncbi:hypothetical protein [Vibrio metschnikovii]|uniref:Uncharacterized protein n=1 Tax=Vibrio metschnikovii TaxID=28172 RepID=A0A9X0RDE6_VIBME|nr:hypothetical protein [Vibrio metschnikovii]MBC5853246.1 hypothetical protein [Vibrio metschnikovii]